MKENEIKIQVEDISRDLEKIKDLSVILSEYFNEKNFEKVNKMKKEDKKPRQEILTSELFVFRRNFEEYGTLLFEIIEKIRKTKNNCDDIIKAISQTNQKKEGEKKK